MQIIIVGCGKVGRALAAQLSGEDNNVTVVDTNGDVVKTVANYYDVMGVAGNGASYSVLAEADIEHTDVLIAVTHNDEVNLLCCVVARKAANCHTIARVRNPVYSEERAFLRKELGLSMIINPEYAAAQEIARLLRFPSAIEIDSFSKGRIEMLRFRVPAASMLDGLALRELPQRLPMDVLICAAERGEEVLIPDGNFVIRSGDLLSMIAIPGNAAAFFKKVGISTNQVKKYHDRRRRGDHLLSVKAAAEYGNPGEDHREKAGTLRGAQRSSAQSNHYLRRRKRPGTSAGRASGADGFPGGRNGYG